MAKSVAEIGPVRTQASSEIIVNIAAKIQIITGKNLDFFLLFTTWPDKHGRIFLVLENSDLSNVRYCTVAHNSVTFYKNQNNTAKFIRSCCKNDSGEDSLMASKRS